MIPFGHDVFPGRLMFGGGEELGFIVIHLIALIDGLILSFLIFIVSFVSMLLQQIRDRKGSHRGMGYAACADSVRWR